jgi:Tfp pilus assembly protein FimT
MKIDRGFTALEIVLVVGVLGLLGGLSLVSFVNSRRVRDAARAGGDILAVLRLAQANAVAGEEGSAWGVRLEQSRILLFRGTDYPSATLTTVYPLPATAEIVNTALEGGGSDVVFRRLDGRTAEAGTFEVRSAGSAVQAFTITIDPSGRAYKSGTAPAAAGTRVTDARHRSFTFNWGIDDAVNLIFTYSDPVDVRTVAMQPLPPRSAYDSGFLTFTVVGFDQTIRIHSLSVAPSQTVLSVDRDCRKNSKKVKISITDGDLIVKDIATYEADCRAVAVGAYGGVMSEP